VTDAAFQAMDADLFAAFGQSATVVRGTAAPVAVTVVIDRGVAKLGEFGQVIGRVTHASFRLAEWQPRVGDVLAFGSESHSIVAIDADDGFVVQAVLHG
jgi:hypothetical protein